MLEVLNISKSFDNAQALDQVSFKIVPGEVFAPFGAKWCRKNNHDAFNHAYIQTG